MIKKVFIATSFLVLIFCVKKLIAQQHNYPSFPYSSDIIKVQYDNRKRLNNASNTLDHMRAGEKIILSFTKSLKLDDTIQVYINNNLVWNGSPVTDQTLNKTIEYIKYSYRDTSFDLLSIAIPKKERLMQLALDKRYKALRIHFFPENDSIKPYWVATYKNYLP